MSPVTPNASSTPHPASEAPAPAPTPLSPEEKLRRAAPVTVDQGFLEDATKAFKEVVALREVAKKLKAERPLTDAERQACDVVIKAADELDDIRVKTISAYAQVVELQQKFIVFMNDFYTKIIDSMNKAMNKKRGVLSQIWRGIKKTLEVITLVLAGAGLAKAAAIGMMIDLIPAAWPENGCRLPGAEIFIFREAT